MAEQTEVQILVLESGNPEDWNDLAVMVNKHIRHVFIAKGHRMSNHPFQEGTTRQEADEVLQVYQAQGQPQKGINQISIQDARARVENAMQVPEREKLITLLDELTKQGYK